MKAIICIIFRSRDVRPKYGEFLWSEKHKCNVWQGRELELEEFNLVADKALQLDRYDISPRPTVRLIPDENEVTSLADIPVEELIKIYGERNREVKAHQLKTARLKKAEKRSQARSPAEAAPEPALAT